MLFSRPAGAVAAAAVAGKRSGSSSGRSRKKQLESSFSIDFRSYVREFLVPLSMLLRPSVPCCFPVRQVRSQQQEKEAGAAAAVAGKSSSNLHLSHCHGIWMFHLHMDASFHCVLLWKVQSCKTYTKVLEVSCTKYYIQNHAHMYIKPFYILKN